MVPWRFWARSFFGPVFGPLFVPLLARLFSPKFGSRSTSKGSKIGPIFGFPLGTLVANFLPFFDPPNRPHFHPNWGLERISRPRTLERRNHYKTNSFSSPRPLPSDPFRVQNWTPTPPKMEPKTGPHPNRPFSNFATKWDPNLKPTFASNSVGEGIQIITISGPVFCHFLGARFGTTLGPKTAKMMGGLIGLFWLL